MKLLIFSLGLLAGICFSANGHNTIIHNEYYYKNLLENGSFETFYNNMEVQGWSYQEDNVFYYWEESKDPKLGEWCGAFGIGVINDQFTNFGLKSKVINVKPSRKYLLSYFYKAESIVASPSATVTVFEALPNYYKIVVWPINTIEVLKQYKESETWIRVVKILEVPANGVAIQIDLLANYDATTEGTYKFDDVSVIELEKGDDLASGLQKLKNKIFTKKYVSNSGKLMQHSVLYGYNSLTKEYTYDYLGREKKVSMPVSIPNSNLSFVDGIFLDTKSPGPVLLGKYNGVPVGEPDAGGYPFTSLSYYTNNPWGKVSTRSKSGLIWGGEEGKKALSIYGTGLYWHPDKFEGLEINNDYNFDYFATDTRDENGNKVVEFTDRSGNISFRYDHFDDTYTVTQYEYDALDRIKKIIHTGPISDDGYKEERTYMYDFLGKQIEETTKSTGKTRFWYDDLDRLRITQNQEQRSEPKTFRVNYFKYDNEGRVLQTGIKVLGAVIGSLPEDQQYAEIQKLANIKDFPAEGFEKKSEFIYDKPTNKLACKVIKKDFIVTFHKDDIPTLARFHSLKEAYNHIVEKKIKFYRMDLQRLLFTNCMMAKIMNSHLKSDLNLQKLTNLN